ncbi:MAG: Maf family protein [Ruminococcus sp.]|nr:Maf family protein [Ruminococcus sp.]
MSEFLKDERIILASASPRRKELLKYITDDFEVIPAEVDEHVDLIIRQDKIAETLAIRKAKAIDESGALIIGCDTIVLCDSKIFTKPKNRADAFNMIKSLSAKTHRVISGVCLKKDKKIKSFSVETQVTFYPISDEEATWYLSTEEPFDKAGAYGIQGYGSVLVKKIDGDFYNVVGLPVSRLKRELIAFTSEGN